jgi:hypothetical protein
MKNRLLALMILLLGVLWLEVRRQRHTIVQLEAIKAEYDAEKRHEAEIERELELLMEFDHEMQPELFEPLPEELQERVKKERALGAMRYAIHDYQFEEWKEKKERGES